MSDDSICPASPLTCAGTEEDEGAKPKKSFRSQAVANQSPETELMLEGDDDAVSLLQEKEIDNLAGERMSERHTPLPRPQKRPNLTDRTYRHARTSQSTPTDTPKPPRPHPWAHLHLTDHTLRQAHTPQTTPVEMPTPHRTHLQTCPHLTGHTYRHSRTSTTTPKLQS